MGTAAFVVAPAEVATADTPVSSVSAGLGHTCAVTGAGGVQCWGFNDFGQLGDNTTVDRSVPADVSGLTSGVAQVSAGAYDTCAVTTAGAVKCWGFNDDHELGDGSTASSAVPVDVVGASSGVRSVATGGVFSCALTTSGAVECWGDNVGSTATAIPALGTGVQALAAGDTSMCALTSAGAVMCWGFNDYGQLGDGTTTDDWTPATVSGLASGVVMIGAGSDHVCVVTAADAVQCWGRNNNGQLGDGTETERHTPVTIDEVDATDIAWIGGGNGETCVLTHGGGVECWGADLGLQLGGASTDRSTQPMPVVGLGAGVASLAIGGDHACALTSDDALQCWGFNEYGQLGDGGSWTEPLAKDVVGLGSGVTATGAGYHHTCAVVSGALECWGQNNRGQLGDGTTIERDVPVDVVALEAGVSAVTGGDVHTCALTNAGAVDCWGSDSNGRLGDGGTTQSSVPLPVSGLGSGVEQISAGVAHTCALTVAGAVECWGSNHDGQLGDGTNVDRHAPVAVSGLSSGVEQIAAGGNFTCALTNHGAVKCWGFPYLGDGTTAGSNSPVQVSGLTSGVTAIAAGGYYGCAVTTGGALKCWGDDIGTGGTNLVPTTVPGASSGVASIDAAASSACLRTVGGAAKCWGDDDFGTLGNGTSGGDYASPVDVIGLSTHVTAVATEGDHACAITTDHALHCWGNNSNGQVGIGPAGESLVPVGVVGLGLDGAVASEAPANVSVGAANGAANASWTAPVDDGGADVYGYVVTVLSATGATASGVAGSHIRVTSTGVQSFALGNGRSAAAGTSTVFAGLSNGTQYRLDVAPLTRAGMGRAKLSPAVQPHAPAPAASGYWMVDSTGHVYAFGSAHYAGNAPTSRVVHIEGTPSGRGYWIIDAAGAVYAFGDAPYLSGAGALAPGEVAGSLSSTPTGHGYWIFTSSGRAVARGDAKFFGDLRGVALRAPIVASVATPTGKGYYMVASDGGVFAFGDARFHGSTGAMHLNQPVVGIVATPAHNGYWLVASDGGVFAFDASFRGSMGGRHLNRPIVAMARYGNGYVLTASDGGVFDFSDKAFSGSLGAHPPSSPIVSVAAFATS
ncbi:MAG TPA: hypothetical protein VH914_06280 [Acidimicrobiia bacterium]|nr:hypothetical protein [Acidimicrobiia bacterium]